MTIRFFILAGVVLLFVGIGFAFLCGQVGLFTFPEYSPWDSQILLFPTVLAIWIPGIYLFFTGIWVYLKQTLPNEERLKNFFQLDVYSYAAILPCFLALISWREFNPPMVFLYIFVLVIIIFKSLILLRTLYEFPQLIRPLILVILSMGIYLLSIPFIHLSLSIPIQELFQYGVFLHLGIIAVKSLCFTVMNLEMFRLSVEMTKSMQSAFFSWLVVSFTFPVLGFPKISSILAGLLVVFILRMFISRVDTKELMVGLLEPASITIAIKLLIVLTMILSAGFIFWSNVKPGTGIQTTKAFEAAIRTMFDGQFGLLGYAPVYWLAGFGVIYLLFFQVWNGILLIVIGTIFFSCYHLAFHGMLGKGIGQHDIVLFLPFLGVFVAVAHSRFSKIILFRVGARFLVSLTVGITSLLMVLAPNVPSFSSKFAEIQTHLMNSVGRDLTFIFPSTSFRPVALNLLYWISSVVILALICCFIRTRSFHPLSKRIRTHFEKYFYFQQLTFYPSLVLLFLTIGMGFFTYAHKTHLIPLEQQISLSKSSQQYTLSLAGKPLSSLQTRGLLIMSHLTDGADIPHKMPLIHVTCSDNNQRFETFAIKAGKDTAEESLEMKNVQQERAHEKSTIYRTRLITTPDGQTIEGHDYYTRLLFSKPMNIQKISMKFFLAQDKTIPSDATFQLKGISLIE